MHARKCYNWGPTSHLCLLRYVFVSGFWLLTFIDKHENGVYTYEQKIALP